MKNIAISTITMIALAVLASAAEPEAAPGAKPAAEIANGDDVKRCRLIKQFPTAQTEA